MQTLPRNPEQIKLEYDALIQEYNSLRTELVATLEAARQVTNYTLVITGFLLPAISLISDYLTQTKSATILLVAPFIFYFLAWTSLRYTILCTSLSNYIRDHIAPKIRGCIFELGGMTETNKAIFRWEDKGKNTLQKYGIFYFPIAGAHYGLPLFGASSTVIIYIIFCSKNPVVIPAYDYLLIFINIVLMIYSVVWGLRIELSR